MMFVRLLLVVCLFMSASEFKAMDGTSLVTDSDGEIVLFEYVDEAVDLEQLIEQARLNGDFEPVLCEIIESQNVERLKQLVPEINASSWRPVSGSPDFAVMAVETSNQKLVGLILDIRAIGDEALRSGWALCYTRRDVDMIKLLLARGMYAHAEGRTGTLLSAVPPMLKRMLFSIPSFRTQNLITDESPYIIESLVEKKIFDPNLELGNKKDRPLHVISRQFQHDNFYECLDTKKAQLLWKMFIKHGADPELKNTDGLTPRDICVQKHGQAEWLELTNPEEEEEIEPFDLENQFNL